MRRLTIPLIAVSALALQGCSHILGFGKWNKAKTDLTHRVEHVRGSALVVKTRNGQVEVAASPEYTGVLIEAHIKCVGRTQAEADDRLARTTLSVGRTADNTLVIEPIFADEARGGDGASITIRLPDAHDADIATSNGRVTATGSPGTVTWIGVAGDWPLWTQTLQLPGGRKRRWARPSVSNC